jgi:hypothetical protein
MFFTRCFPQKAVTIVPVADLLGRPAPCALNDTYYQQLPICSKNSTNDSRIHQLLFNEVVEIKEQKHNQVFIHVPNAYYQLGINRNTQFWALEGNLIPFDVLTKKGIDIKKIPTPISSKKQTNSSVIILKAPFYCKKLQMHFSAGTRFVVSQEMPETMLVYALNPTAMKMELIDIPKKNIMEQSQNPEGKIKCFVQVLKEFAHLPRGFIPYVWGGCSFIQACTREPFEIVQRETAVTYCRPELKQIPFTGFDCSGLIWRSAQICGIPLYAKNSSTMAKELTQLKKTDKINNGDIIWIPGHVMVISDMQKNLIIEARSYGHGYGKVQELPINQIFKDINSFSDLINAIHHNQRLVRLDNAGNVVQTIDSCKILKLSSVWKKST